jgi:4-amino-4-deoxy-L-arabinose transferase-like glycosyltransferase
MTVERSRDNNDRLWLVGIVVLAAALRLWGLPSWEWDGDELYTIRDARDLGASAVRTGAPGIAARPIYYLIQFLLLKVFPETPFFLRLPAATFGVLGVIATWWVARRVFGSVAGLVAALMVTLSPWHLFASQFARYWTLVYLEATLLFCVLAKATSDDDKAWYRAACALLVVGTLTHPTFLFPVVGCVLALHLMREDGRFGLRLPRTAGWLNLWIPFFVVTVAGYWMLRTFGTHRALQNQSIREIRATFTLIPGMVQWMEPVIAGTAAISATYLLFGSSRPEDRRWGLMALLGTGSAFVILFLASFKTAVYADYGISALPLAYVCIGGLVQRSSERLSGSVPWVVAAAILVVGVLPGTVSHLIDGTRFDYRPAHEAIRALGPDRPVFGGVEDITRRALPSTTIIPYSEIDSLPKRTGFWFIASQRRYGLREGGKPMQRWIDWNCRRILTTERQRFDYRLYRTELYWCGTDPAPAPRS